MKTDFDRWYGSQGHPFELRDAAYAVWQAATQESDKRIAKLESALMPFAKCGDRIDPAEDDEEWAKFRLLIKDYREAADAYYNRQDRCR